MSAERTIVVPPRSTSEGQAHLQNRRDGEDRVQGLSERIAAMVGGADERDRERLQDNQPGGTSPVLTRADLRLQDDLY